MPHTASSKHTHFCPRQWCGMGEKVLATRSRESHTGVLLHKLVRTQTVPHSLQAILGQSPSPPSPETPSTLGASLPGQRPPGLHVLLPPRTEMQQPQGAPRRDCTAAWVPQDPVALWVLWLPSLAGGEKPLEELCSWVTVGENRLPASQRGEGKTSSLSCLLRNGDLIVANSEFPCTGDVGVWV